MTYSESAEGVKVTRVRAIKELRDHGIIDDEIEIFLDEVKADSNGLYCATELLEWLGY